MSQTSLISSHVLTPRWTHAIDVRAQSRREDLISLAAIGLSLLAVLRDQAVPLAPVPLADLPRRVPERPAPATPPKGPSPLNVPQEIESVPDQQAIAAG
ncbi:MAG TPA: hypothetical protein VE861_06965 [Gemmatimonadaceae bacterium]|nr:hypothetical protein [Gemmatimonadaceae bacterium]